MVSIGKHPSPDAAANWHLVQVSMGAGKDFTVVCGGEGYKVGDVVAYVPVGQKVKGSYGRKVSFSLSVSIYWVL